MIEHWERSQQPDRGKQFPAKKLLVAVSIVFLMPVLLFLFYPQFFTSIAHKTIRIKNALSYYIFQEKPHFYYLEMEKNGKDIRIRKGESLEITYKDEFVVKSVVSDDLTGKYTTIQVQGLSRGNNDLGVLLRGLDIVDKIIKSGYITDKTGEVSSYKIIIKCRGEVTDAVEIKVLLTPQDWFRFAQDSSRRKDQIDYLQKAIALNKNDVSVRKILAGIYVRQNRVDEAAQLYKDVLKIKSDDTVAMLELTKMYIKKKDYDAAGKMAKEITRINPKATEAYLLLGFSMEEKGSWDQAVQNYRKAVILEPDHYPARLKLGAAYIKRNMVNAAITEYKYVANDSPEPEPALFALGDIYLKLKRNDDAVKCYQAILKKQPQNSLAHANLAAANAASGRVQKEIVGPKKIVSRDTKDSNGRLLNTKEKAEKRKKEIDASDEKSANSKETLSNLAELYLKQKNYQKAIGIYQKLVKLEPKKAGSYANLGYAYAAGGKLDLAIRNYNMALKFDSEDADVYDNLGEVYESKGLYQKALENYKKAYALNPESPKASQRIPMLKIKLLQEKNSRQTGVTNNEKN